MQIFLVMGESHNYDESMRWPVKGFIHGPDAEDFKKACQEEANRIEKEYEKIMKDLDDFRQDMVSGNVKATNAEYKLAQKETRDRFEELMSSRRFDTKRVDDTLDKSYDIEMLEVE